MKIDKKIEAFEKNLLDTGKRNRLINYKSSSSSTLSLVTLEPKKLEAGFLAGKSYTFTDLFDSVNDEFYDEDVKEGTVNTSDGLLLKKDIYDASEILELSKRYKAKAGVNPLFTTTITSKQNKVIRKLINKNRTMLEENGGHILYISFAFLSYTDKDSSKLISPLVMYPLNIYQKNLKDSFRAEIIDNSFVVNDTLIRKLKTEQNIDLEFDTNNMDSSEYLEKIKTIIEPLNFSILNNVTISLFSFSKIKMYNDVLEHKELIKKSEIIKALAGEKNKLNGKEISSYDIKDRNIVVEADSSQLKAINYAKSGKSFVLQGPPGTGKSQTITNIIAELMAMNKTVLFVCEKTSAMEVVYQKLKKVNLDRFVLALHEKNINKKSIVDSLLKELQKSSSKRIVENNNIKELYKDLNSSEEQIKNILLLTKEKQTPFSNSFYDLINDYLGLASVKEVYIDDYNILEEDSINLKNEMETVYSFFVAKKRLGDYKANSFYGLSLTSLGFSLSQKLQKLLLNLDKFVRPFVEYKNSELLEFKTINGLNNLSYIVKNIKIFTNIDKALYKMDIKDDTLEILSSVKASKELMLKDKAYIDKSFNSDVYTVYNKEDLLALKEKYQGLLQHTFNKDYKKLRNKYSLLLKKEKKLHYDAFVKDLEVLDNFFVIKSNILKKLKRIKGVTLELSFDYKKIINDTLMLIEYNKIDDSLYEEDASFYDKFFSLFNDEDSLNSNVNYFKDVVKYYNNFNKYLTDFRNHIDPRELDLNNINLDILSTKFKSMLNNYESINDYIEFYSAKSTILENYPYLESLVLSENSYSVYEKSIKGLYITKYIESNIVLNQFNKREFDGLVSEYASADDELISICDSKIISKLISSWPIIDNLGIENSEVTVLRREANKKRKLLPLNKLFNEISGLLTKIKPVFMMSPLGVSSFLDPEKFHFDTVIFDEASQMKTESAAVALYRADSVIVVGDTEQLPPTSFFDRIENDDDEFVNPFESVLSEADTVLPRIMLEWHYRSLDERLIAFSNNFIYKSLITIPNSTYSDKSFGVSYEYCPYGVYSQGLRTNKIEAAKVVELIFKHIKNNTGKTLGVVTLNTSQQELINNLILKKRYSDKSYEEFFSIKDNFFVKNLETVQGDERDVIILSIGFAKTADGSFSMNFGPINKDGGYRRLNVAVTRAKEQVILVGSVKPEDFHLNKDSSRGSLMLLDYLKYSIDSSSVISNEVISDGDNILNSIKYELNKRGYEVDLNVGLSVYKVDVAVKVRDKYVLAILLDGSNFDKFSDIRSKEKIRQNLLLMRGWDVYNTLSLAYAMNKDLEIKNIISILEGNTTEVVTNIIDDTSTYFETKEVEASKSTDLFCVYPDEESLVKKVSEEYFEIKLRIIHIIEALAPIEHERLLRLLLPLYYKNRLTEKQRGIMEADIESVSHIINVYKTGGFILIEKNLTKIDFRISDPLNKQNRKIKEIYEEEISSGIVKLLNQNKSVLKDSLFSELNNLLDFNKMTSDIKEAYDNAVTYLISREVIKEVSGILYLV